MQQGRLRLPTGFSILCRYRFDSVLSGKLDLGTALYNALPTSSEATLTPTDGRERRIRILLEAQPAMAAFEVISEESPQ